MSSYPAKYDFVSDGLSPAERKILDVVDSRLFNNPDFLQSEFSPDNWPSELRVNYAQAVTLMAKKIDIQKKSNGKHEISWKVDSLDRILDDLGVYKDMCVHCYGKTGYDTREGVRKNYIRIVIDKGHIDREKLKTLAYLVAADGEGILLRRFMENDPSEIDLLHKRKLDQRTFTAFGVGSFAYQNISFMSQIEMPDGTLVSYPTMSFGMVGNVKNEKQAVERVYDYMRKKLTHFTGNEENFADIYRPYTSTPYSPPLGLVVEVGQAGSPSSSAAITGVFRVLGLPAEQFLTRRNIRRASSVKADGQTYYYNGNDFPGRKAAKTAPVCVFFRTLDQVEDHEYDRNCDK